MKTWKHKDHSGKFKGSYERDKKGERVFVLTSSHRRIVFESFQMAKKLKWRIS